MAGKNLTEANLRLTELRAEKTETVTKRCIRIAVVKKTVLSLVTGVALSMVVIFGFAGCGGSDSETRIRNSLAVDQATVSSEVSKGASSKDADYNDPVASIKMVCAVGDNQISAVSINLAPLAKGAENEVGLAIRLPKVDSGKIVEHKDTRVLTKTIYLTDERNSTDLCENLKSNSRAIVAENEAHLLAALGSLKPQKDQLPKGALENLLPPFVPPKLLKRAPINSDADTHDIAAQIELVVPARGGEPTAELIARQQAILTAIDICPSRIEEMRNSHPLGPFALRVLVVSIGSAYAPSKCGLGLSGESGAINSESWETENRTVWGEVCAHPHGSIRILEGSSCAAAGFE